MVNNVIGVVNYVIAARPSLLNFVIADKLHATRTQSDAERVDNPRTRRTSRVRSRHRCPAQTWRSYGTGARGQARARWVQPSMPEIRNETAKTSAGSEIPAQARSIIWPQRSSISALAVRVGLPADPHRFRGGTKRSPQRGPVR